MIDYYDYIFEQMKQEQTFHESKQWAADDQQVVLVDIDETVAVSYTHLTLPTLYSV